MEKMFDIFKNQFGYEINKNCFEYAHRKIYVHVNNDGETFSKQSGMIFKLYNDENEYIYFPCDNKIYVCND